MGRQTSRVSSLLGSLLLLARVPPFFPISEAFESALYCECDYSSRLITSLGICSAEKVLVKRAVCELCNHG